MVKNLNAGARVQRWVCILMHHRPNRLCGWVGVPMWAAQDKLLRVCHKKSELARPSLVSLDEKVGPAIELWFPIE